MAFGEAGFTATGTTSATGLAFTLGTSQNGGRAVTHGAGLYVTVGGNSSAASTDGRHWQAAVYPGNASGVAFGSGRFVAVGANRLYRSADGISFTGVTIATNQTSNNTTPSFSHVFCADGTFVATTGNSQAFVSTDGVAWSERFTGVRGTFMGSMVANGLAVLATWEGKLIGLAIEDPGSHYVTVPPAAVTTRPAGSTLELSATTIGAGTLSYQWTRNGAPLVDGPPVPPATGGLVSGATTPSSSELRHPGAGHSEADSF